MAKRRSAEQIVELQAQAAAARRAAETATDIFTQDLSFAAAATLESVARSQLRQLAAEESVLVLADNASVTEMRQARQRRAVRRGDDVYLPTWREATVGIPMPRLLDVLFDDGYQGRDTPERLLKGSDLISFRVLDSMARLFGPEDWSAVSHTALHDYSGLPAWLASYYSTHAKPYPVKIEDLFKWSGVVCEFREFRRRLKRSLERLQRDDVSDNVRVSAFELTDTHLTVELFRW